MNFVPQCFVLLTVLTAAIAAHAETPMNETRSTLEKWVETRQLVSRTKSEWQSDKEMLQQTIELLNRELKAVDEQMTKLNTNTVQADKERALAEASLKSSNESLEKSKEFTTRFEEQIRKLVPQLPNPLQDTLKPLLNRLPADAATTKMAPTERVQVSVGILNELDKFNNAVSLFNEKRKNAKGEEVAVETVYIGLGAAYFVNESGDFAGTGTPGAAGWEWNVKPELAPSVREVIRIYRNERPAKFIALPATVR
jgi:septal ring factor EnvC (AmiA/AmiB activator)